LRWSRSAGIQPDGWPGAGGRQARHPFQGEAAIAQIAKNIEAPSLVCVLARPDRRRQGSTRGRSTRATCTAGRSHTMTPKPSSTGRSRKRTRAERSTSVARPAQNEEYALSEPTPTERARAIYPIPTRDNAGRTDTRTRPNSPTPTILKHRISRPLLEQARRRSGAEAAQENRRNEHAGADRPLLGRSARHR
jgi:hypothetical protein